MISQPLDKFLNFSVTTHLDGNPVVDFAYSTHFSPIDGVKDLDTAARIINLFLDTEMRKQREPQT